MVELPTEEPQSFRKGTTAPLRTLNDITAKSRSLNNLAKPNFGGQVPTGF